VDVESEGEACGLARGVSTLLLAVTGLGEGVCAKELSAHSKLIRQSPSMFFIKQKSRILERVIGLNQIFEIRF
jgi:hypothetical protein